jgi:hypothetical protein
MGKIRIPCKDVVGNVEEKNEENVDVNKRIILRHMLNKYDLRIWTTLKWLRICMNQ